MNQNRPLFQLGQVVATPGALEAFEQADQTPLEILRRHAAGDWGEELGAEDKALNDQALRDGSRILSAYRLKSGTKVWIITEAEDDQGRRASSCCLLPSEY